MIVSSPCVLSLIYMVAVFIAQNINRRNNQHHVTVFWSVPKSQFRLQRGASYGGQDN